MGLTPDHVTFDSAVENTVTSLFALVLTTRVGVGDKSPAEIEALYDQLTSSLNASISQGTFVETLVAAGSSLGANLSSARVIKISTGSLTKTLPPPAPVTGQHNRNTLNGGEIAGIVIACVVVIAALFGVVIWCRSRNDKDVVPFGGDSRTAPPRYSIPVVPSTSLNPSQNSDNVVGMV